MKRTANVEATSKCVVSVLIQDDLNQFAETYPEIQKVLQNEARNRLISLSKNLKLAGRSLDPELSDQFSFLNHVRFSLL